MVKRILLYSSANELADSNGKENINKFLESKSNNKRIIKGWAFYDWANSAFALVISVAVFPAYFINTTPDTIPILGMEMLLFLLLFLFLQARRTRAPPI